MLKDRVIEDMKGAMRARDAARLSPIRMLLAAIKQKEIDDRVELDDTQVTAVVNRQIKQRRDSIEAFTKGGRPELAQQEQEEIDIIQTFLPQQMSDHEIDVAVETAIKDAQASSLKQMGQVMGLLRERYSGRMDFAKAGAQVKARLG